MAKLDLSVLVIDINSINLDSLKAVLSTLFQEAKIYTVQNDIEGIEQMITIDPDVILMDILILEMDGFNILKGLKEDERLKNIPLVFLSDRATDQTSRIKALKTGADAFLSKSFDEAEIFTTFSAMIKIKSANRFSQLEKEHLAKKIDERTKELEEQLAERERIEKALRESEERFRLHFEDSPLPSQSLDKDGNIIAVNKAWLTALGYTHEEVIGRWFGDFLPIDYQEVFKERFPLFKKMGEIIGEEIEIVDKDGSMRIVTFDGRVGLNPDGSYRQSYCVFKDQTKLRQIQKALHEKELEYQLLVENLSSGIVVHAPDTKILFSNQMASFLLGLTEEQMIGKDAINPDWRCLNEDGSLMTVSEYPVNKVLASGKPLSGQFVGICRPDLPEPVWVLCNAYPKNDSEGRISHVVVSFSDVTRRKRAEEALKNSNELLSLFIRHSPIYAFIKEVTPNQSIVVHASDNYQQMIGLTGQEIIGKNMAELFPPEFAAKITADDWTVVSNGKILTLDEDLDDRNYTTIKFPITLGERTLLAGYTIDITERNRIERVLRSSEEKFRKAFMISPDSININRLHDGMFISINKGFTEIMGYTEADVAGKTSDELKIWADPADRIRLSDELRKNRSVSNLEARFKRKDGGIKYGLMSASLIDIDGTQHILSITRDITDRKLAEEERDKLHAQVVQLMKLESVGRLAGGVAHDFNNMLGIIIGHSEMAMCQLDPSQPIYDDLSEIRKAAERSADLTRQLLAFARRQTASPRLLNLNDTIESMLKMLRRLIGEDIDLVWQPRAGIWTIKMDPTQIDQILANLCINARDALVDVGKIIIETDNVIIDTDFFSDHTYVSPGEYVLLSLSDNGCGMDKDTLRKVFEPFFTTKEIGKGTGLGLSTLYGIVKQNRGFVNVYSEPGQGTTFKIYFPRFYTIANPVQTAISPEPIKMGQETILLVEDEPTILDMTTKMLERLGYSVLAANTPGEAIRLAEKHSGDVHLLMTDVIMPGMNGQDLTKKLLSIYPELKHLFMSGYTADIISHHGVLDEGIPFIQKPFSITNLSAKIREVLGSE
jgi:PAS domain S-box-containing protein